MKICLALMLLLAPVGWAAKVGPLDGAAGPSLPAVSMPTLVAETELFNPSLPLSLEKIGLNDAALLEWARLLPEAYGDERRLVLGKLALLSLREGHDAAAAQWLRDLQADFPNEMESLEMLLIRLERTKGDARVPLLARMASAFPEAEPSLTARRADVMRQALDEGVVRQDWGVPEATQVKAKLQALEHTAQRDTLLAIGLGIIPGVGYAYLGMWGEAAMLLLGWCVLGWAFAAACRHRHYAYALVFALPWVALWMNAPVAAGLAAEAQAKSIRIEALGALKQLP
jgi:hypothetical protein